MSGNNISIEHLIQQVIFLLKNNDCEDWVMVFKELLRDCKMKQKNEVAKKIIRLYGGMGTFNDVTLYKDRKPLLEENDKLDELREALYNACEAYITRDDEGNIVG